MNSGFKFIATDETAEGFIEKLKNSGKLNQKSILEIEQNEEGLDIEDRIDKCNKFLLEIGSVKS